MLRRLKKILAGTRNAGNPGQAFKRFADLANSCRAREPKMSVAELESEVMELRATVQVLRMNLNAADAAAEEHWKDLQTVMQSAKKFYEQKVELEKLLQDEQDLRRKYENEAFTLRVHLECDDKVFEEINAEVGQLQEKLETSQREYALATQDRIRLASELTDAKNEINQLQEKARETELAAQTAEACSNALKSDLEELCDLTHNLAKRTNRLCKTAFYSSFGLPPTSPDEPQA